MLNVINCRRWFLIFRNDNFELSDKTKPGRSKQFDAASSKRLIEEESQAMPGSILTRILKSLDELLSSCCLP